MRNKINQLKKVTFFLDENSNQYLPVVDRILEFRKKSKKTSAVAFKTNRKEKLKILRKKFRRAKPVPGGVGYGIYYKQNYQWAFSNFACLDFGILVPSRVAGGSTGFLYLTATNGTAKGVEALISYKGQGTPVFMVFDWAKPKGNQWVLSIPVNNMRINFSKITINGIQHNYCRVLNRTEKIGVDLWENKVCLFNFSNNNWDLVYGFQYHATLQSQKDTHYGSWGPIVETFQKVYTNLNPMGFCNVMLYNDSNTHRIAPQNSTIRDDNDGIDVTFIDPNWTFYVE